MKKSTVSLVALGLFSVGLLAPLTGFAEELLPGQSLTKGKVIFNEPTGTVDPIDPTDPTKPDPDPDPNNPGTGQKGALTLDALPILDFGEHDIAAGTQVYTVKKPEAPFIQVSDRRGVNKDGKAQGWTVTVAMSEFVDGEQKLEDATLSFSKASVQATIENQGQGPAARDVLQLSSKSVPQTILGASENFGLGTWLSSYKAENVKLTVPKPAKGNFESTLTWSINNTPVS